MYIKFNKKTLNIMIKLNKLFKISKNTGKLRFMTVMMNLKTGIINYRVLEKGLER